MHAHYSPDFIWRHRKWNLLLNRGKHCVSISRCQNIHFYCCLVHIKLSSACVIIIVPFIVFSDAFPDKLIEHLFGFLDFIHRSGYVLALTKFICAQLQMVEEHSGNKHFIFGIIFFIFNSLVQPLEVGHVLIWPFEFFPSINRIETLVALYVVEIDDS